ncbi:hypothetical protein [Pseudomonas sp. Irchel s3b6]|uniref:hypothetical protein n=1 Tax=Pseudomonas sp. Irchel s3b6 TaxID=2009078 RepID=UPI00114047A0|nr:hypothetical protein [Pseudomonas sp. Irchel s3b6]
MSSTKLKILERQMARQSPEKIPVPADDDLAVAIQRLVDQRVEAALEQRPVKQPAHVRRLMDDFNRPEPTTDFRQIPPTPRAVAPKAMEMSFQRDELGRINLVNAGLMQWRVQRNEVGQIVRMVPADIAPMPPAIAPPVLAEARTYDPGTSR